MQRRAAPEVQIEQMAFAVANSNDDGGAVTSTSRGLQPETKESGCVGFLDLVVVRGRAARRLVPL
jgi:hypothetical protein